MEGEKKRESPLTYCDRESPCDTNFHLNPTAANETIRPSLCRAAERDRRFSHRWGSKSYDTKAPRRPRRETRDNVFRAMARDIMQQASFTTARHDWLETLILPDPNCRPDYVSSLLRMERQSSEIQELGPERSRDSKFHVRTSEDVGTKTPRHRVTNIRGAQI